MSFETELLSTVPSALVQASGGSIIVLGLISLTGIAIIFKKLQIGFSSSIVITTFIVGMLSLTVDQNSVGGKILPFTGFFEQAFFLIVFGMAVIFALSIMRQR